MDSLIARWMGIADASVSPNELLGMLGSTLAANLIRIEAYTDGTGAVEFLKRARKFMRRREGGSEKLPETGYKFDHNEIWEAAIDRAKKPRLREALSSKIIN